ncbi:hypothetical protein GGI21_004285, partial [Coemansia aciculifera]
MSEGFTDEHKKLYQYAGTSNLVLPSERVKGAAGRRGERGKEIESLWGKIDVRTMGAAVRPSTVPTGKARERSTGKKHHYHTLLPPTDDDLVYQPQTQETRRIWDL